MTRGRAPTADDRRNEDAAKAMYLDTKDFRTLEEIAAAFGKTIGWILGLKRRDGWPERVSAREIKLHGELAEDVVYLRTVCRLLVARFQDGYRINRDVVTGEQLQDRAKDERDLRAIRRAAAKPRPAIQPSEPPPTVVPPPTAAPAPVPQPAPAAPEPPPVQSTTNLKAKRLADMRARDSTHRLTKAVDAAKVAPIAQTSSSFALPSRSPVDRVLLERVDKLEAQVKALLKVVSRDHVARRRSLNFQSQSLIELEGLLPTNKAKEAT